MTRTVVVGPLAGHEDGLRCRLIEDGYALDTVRERGFSVLCVGSGVALCFSGFPFVGGPPITAGTCLHAKGEINPR
ncbi:hypothetical protein [Streptomyces javensis]|uniref:Uncharacterized protein n=1 Tax=Streptomyces javensis TaxID=114698 RepID=A0ABP4HZP1_9ACTN